MNSWSGGFGRERAIITPGRAGDVSALTIAGDELWIVLPERLLVYHTRGRLLRVLDVDLGEPLIDVAHYGAMTYLLTPTRLLRTRL